MLWCIKGAILYCKDGFLTGTSGSWNQDTANSALKNKVDWSVDLKYPDCAYYSKGVPAILFDLKEP